MQWRMSPRLAMAALVLAVVGLAMPAGAQVFTGRVDVTVQDSTGAVLPGVTVNLTGPANQTQTTDTMGEAHFLNLPVGTYQVNATLQGFNPYKNTNVQVVAGGSVPLAVKLGVAGTQETVQVPAESPIVDTKKETTSTNVSLQELQEIPTARDPWVVLQTVPTIIVDRVNVGGSESGQQSAYMAKGASGSDNTWNLDGIPITDMAATGSTPTYWDFDMFQEMNVTTGGADVSNPTPGVQLNLVMKQGTNVPHGNARIYDESQRLQRNNMSPSLAAAIGGTSGQGNRTDKYQDYGFDLGGPIVKDKLWAWGSAGKTYVNNITLSGTHDATTLKNYAFKATGQANQWARLNFTFFRGNKLKFGRGAGPTVSDESAWNQDGPTNLYKGEADLVFGNNLFVTGRVARMTSGFELVPRGGLNANIYIDAGGVLHGSQVWYQSNRPQDTVMADGSYFRGRHEVKFGFSWRKTPVTSSSTWPGNHVIFDQNADYATTGMGTAQVLRDWSLNTDARYTSFYAGDTITFNRATVNASLRYDHQVNSLLATSVPGVAGFENILPALTASAVPNAITWNLPSPRIGITYQLDQNHKTQVRASYAMFASQLGASTAGIVSTIQYSDVYYYAVDANRNNVVDPGEIQLNLGPISYTGFDVNNPSLLQTFNRIGSYKTPRTHEFVVGIDHELMANVGVSGSFTYRRYNDLTWEPLIGVRAPDYFQSSTFTGTLLGNSFSVPVYGLPAANVPPGAGQEYVTREGYHQRYLGFEASLTKRLANRWMARLGFSTNDDREYFDNPATSLQDPTPGVCPGAPSSFPSCPNINGGEVVTRASGSGKSNIFLVMPRYQFIANGMWQGPLGIDLGANFVLRQGYAEPYYRSRVAAPDPVNGLKSVLVVSSVDQYRLPAVTNLDVRLEKAFKFARYNVILDLDGFNILNRATTLGIQYDMRRTGLTGFNQVLEIMNPTIFRLGARFTF